MLTKVDFKEIFDQYFDAIRSYIFYRCGNEEQASDMAQDVFMKVWEKREELDNQYIKSLLYKMANHMVIDNYRKDVVQLNFQKSITVDYDTSPEENFLFEEVKTKYSKALEDMPENQRIVFLMSRSEELKYKEIAERLDLSVKAVEKRMGIALQYLRDKLQ